MTSLKLVAEARLARGSIPVYKYVSEATGLKVVLAGVEGPVVNGYFPFATEAFDDDGLPHTLEHLIFLGSESYPYKGVLDLLANRCLASGTNAWTDTDHTCYTMTTAGKDGFLELLPIYLDHVLYPTLSDSAFITEVHHVSGDGEDGGVVYCEMQGRENSGESLSHYKLMQLAYPNCAYSSETGGIMHNLRTSTTNQKVRDYHKQFYRSDNLTILIAGQVSIDEVAKALEPVEARILRDAQRPPFVKPWTTPVAPLEKSEDIHILYPSDEEDCGMVLVGWRGPLCTQENLKLTACSVLLRYLTDTSVSPLQREFVELPDPYASQITFTINENYESLLHIGFENVPMDKIQYIGEKLHSTLLNIVVGNEDIDMVRMKNILERNILEYLNNLESSPHDAVAFLIIADSLYGNTPEDFDMRLNVNKQLEYLQTVDHAYWIALLKEYLVDGHSIVVRAAPSINEQQRMAQVENDRIDKQRIALGPEGLATKGEELLDAMDANNELPPEDMLRQVAIPSLDHINFHPLTKYSTNSADSPPGLRLSELPCFAEAYDVHSNFVYMFVTLNSQTVPTELRSLLSLFLDLITESPIRRGDVLISHQEVVTALERDTISLGTTIGIDSNTPFSCGPYSNTATVILQVEPKKFELGVQWLVDLLHNTEFTVERVRVCASKISNAVSQAKRKGNSVVSDLLKAMYYKDDTNVRLNSMLHQLKFLNALLEKLDSPDSTAIVDLNRLRDELVKPENMAIHIAANWSKLNELNIDLTAPWVKLSTRVADKKESLQVTTDYSLLKPVQPTDTQGTIVGMGCIESAFLYHASPCLKSFSDPDLPALMLFLQYLTQLEGPLWRQLRGQGFAYGYNMMPKPNEGLLYFTLYRATNVVGAFRETKSIIDNQIKPDAVWDETLFESAKSSLIFEVIEREKSVGDLVVQALLGSFKGVPTNYNQTLVKSINAVTVDDLRRIGKVYISKLFSDESNTAIVCHPDKTTDIAQSFVQFGRKLTVETSLEESALGKF